MSLPLPPDPYHALGVSRDATAGQIKTAYRKLVLQLHPDRVLDESQKQAACDRFHEIQAAWEIVADEDRRARYDAQCKLAQLKKEMMERKERTPVNHDDVHKLAEGTRWGYYERRAASAYGYVIKKPQYDAMETEQSVSSKKSPHAMRSRSSESTKDRHRERRTYTDRVSDDRSGREAEHTASLRGQYVKAREEYFEARTACRTSERPIGARPDTDTHRASDNELRRGPEYNTSLQEEHSLLRERYLSLRAKYFDDRIAGRTSERPTRAQSNGRKQGDDDRHGLSHMSDTAGCIDDSTSKSSSNGSASQPITLDRKTDYEKVHRRGRGARMNAAFWKEYNPEGDNDPFDGRECLFADRNGRVRVPAMANLDTQLKVPNGMVMSPQYAKELGRYEEISTDFVDPCLTSISGHKTPVVGILRNVPFRLKGTSVTFKRDFWICDAINGLVDVMFGAHFLRSHLHLLFEKIKNLGSMFAPWFSAKKESPEEKLEREKLEVQAKIEAAQRELVRLTKERADLDAARRRRAAGGAGGGQ